MNQVLLEVEQQLISCWKLIVGASKLASKLGTASGAASRARWLIARRRHIINSY